jgi:hypothetical protein
MERDLRMLAELAKAVRDRRALKAGKRFNFFYIFIFLYITDLSFHRLEAKHTLFRKSTATFTH